MLIGKLSIGLRANARNTWKRYIIPKETQGKNHPYYAIGIWWLGFYFYYPKKCPKCGEWMPTCGGTYDCDEDGNIKRVVCKKCADKCYMCTKFA